MSGEIAQAKTQDLSAPSFSREQMDLLKATVCKGATDTELMLFAHVCRKLELDPFSKQIYAIKRWDSALKQETLTFQIGIDGFRALAERTGELDGQEGPMWCGPDGVWKEIWTEKTPPHSAQVFVYRKGCSKPFRGVARWDAYAQKRKDGELSGKWRDMGPEQLAKCAESLGLRKAFPARLSGLYTTEEMGQAENVETKAELRLDGAILSAVDEHANGLWKVTDITTEKYLVSVPEIVEVARKAIRDKQPVDFGYHFNSKKTKVIDWMEPVRVTT